MPKTLVIVESPTKAKTISRFLGSAYTVESSLGHVRDLPKTKMGIDIEHGTFEPHYIVSKDKSAHVKKLKDLAKKSREVIFATDEDREGEAISWHLAELLDITPETAKRIVFHEITKHAIDEALKHPRQIDLHLVDAQQARRILDRLVGYELSPFLWKKVARGLSAGRVQSVAVRLIVEREREIQAFITEEFWTLKGVFLPVANQTAVLTTTLYAKHDKKLDKFTYRTKEEMDQVLTDLSGVSYVVTAVEQKETNRNPLAPFTTSTLQQAANHKLGYSAKQTMRLAQQLYEGIKLGEEGSVGLITYMRTDSVNLSEKFVTETYSFVEKEFGKTYTAEKPRVFKATSKNAQEAHEAIRPTDPARTPESVQSYLDPQQFRLYKLIWQRAVATQMAAAVLNKATIDVTGGDYTFRATGQTMVFAGWLKIYPESIKEEMLPTVAKGDQVNCDTLTPEQHFTEPPARYSDATLVKAMEEFGIGRPSTYAPTIGTIEARNYVERDDNKRLKPTEVGVLVNDLLVEHFTAIVDYEFTATMEESLDDIAAGTKQWQPVITMFYHPFHEAVIQKSSELTREDVVSMRQLGTDPASGKPIFVRIGRFGPFVQKGAPEDTDKPTFAPLKKTQTAESITLEEALVLLTLPRSLGTDGEGNELTVSIGRFGPYVKSGKTFYSIKEDDPYTISREKALDIIQVAKDKKAREIIKSFPNETVVVKDGRYGPYITDGNKNAKIPKDTDPASLSLETCQQLLAEAKPKRGKFVAKKTKAGKAKK